MEGGNGLTVVEINPPTHFAPVQGRSEAPLPCAQSEQAHNMHGAKCTRAQCAWLKGSWGALASAPHRDRENKRKKKREKGKKGKKKRGLGRLLRINLG